MTAPTGTAATAAQALDMVGADPHAAARLAADVLVVARDPGERAVAWRALGLARQLTGDLDSSLAAVRKAIATAEAAGLAVIAAEARMSLAFVLLDRGRPAAALGQAARAAGGLEGPAAARLRTQRALVLQRCGRLDEALAEHRRALPVLQRAGDRLWEARLRNNRGLLLAYRGDLDGAEADLVRAGELMGALGQPLMVAYADCNLGFVAARRGDLPRALARYDSASQAYRAAGGDLPELLRDRAEVLLAAGLLEDAAAAARVAAEGLAAKGRDTDLAEVQLLQAEIALAAGRSDAAELAAAAAARFLRQSRRGWALSARTIALRAAPTPTAAARLSRELAAVGWRDSALSAAVTGAHALLSAGRTREAATVLTTARAARSHGGVDLRVRAWHAEALLRKANGRPAAADAALRAGQRVLDRHRAGLGDSELRALAARTGRELGRTGLDWAYRDGDARRVLAWSERIRAARPLLRHDEDDPRGPLLADLRRVRAELDAAQREGGSTSALKRRVAQCERAVSTVSRSSAGGAAVGVGTGPDLGDATLCCFVEVDTDLVAVTVCRGRAALHRIGPAEVARDHLATLHFALRRLSAGAGPGAALRSLRACAKALDAMLPPAARGDDPLVVVPTSTLHGLPWSLLPALRGRPVFVVPSVSAFSAARTVPAAPFDGPGLVVAGPGLAMAPLEITDVARLRPAARRLSGEHADVGSVLAGLETVSWAHIAAHGLLRTDNPLFSSLTLADGPLTVHDLERLRRVPPLVLLSACSSGVGAVRGGEQVLGLATALLSLGARTLVATTGPVADEASRTLSVALHARLATGADPAAALAAVQAEVGDAEDPRLVAAAAATVSLGS